MTAQIVTGQNYYFWAAVIQFYPIDKNSKYIPKFGK
jgi:hypothetical protein